MQLHDLTEAEWHLIRKVIPISARLAAKPEAVRGCVNGILWRMRTGEPWPQIPRAYGSFRFVYSRFVEWRRSGIWHNVTEILAEARAKDRLQDASRAGIARHRYSKAAAAQPWG